MKFIRKMFVDYSVSLLLLPFSIFVGLYTVKSQLLSFTDSNWLLLYFYIGFIFFPFTFLFFQSSLGDDVLKVGKNFKERFLIYKWIYFVFILVFSLFFLYMAAIHISTFFERDQWILAGDLPTLPIDMIVLPRIASVLSWFVPIDIAIPLLNLAFIIFWFCFLVYVTPVEKYTWINVLLVFGFTVFAGGFYTTLYASFELPSALVCFVGIYGIWKRKYNLGFFLLIMGGVFKNTGIFHVAAGGGLLLFVLWKDRNFNFKKITNLLSAPLVIFLIIYFILNHWGQFYYILAERGGPGYIVATDASDFFLLSSVVTFIYYLFKESTILFLLGIMGILLEKDKKHLAVFSFFFLLVLRSFSKLADGGYAIMFIPALSFFSLFGIGHVWNFLGKKRIGFIMLIALIIFNFKSIWDIVHFIPGGMNHRNSNFGEYVAKLARRFPDDGYIYQKDISVLPYLRDIRGDLDAIRFRPFPEIRQDALTELALPGCKLIVISKDDLAWIGVSEIDLMNMGYSDKPYILRDSSGNWVSYSKECNAWEYK